MSETRAVTCFHCGARFDSLRSRWCECIRSTRTLVCPGCERCSCEAPVEWLVAHGTMTRRPLRAAQPAVGVEDVPPVPAAKPARPKLLVVDDDRFVQHLVREGLGDQFDVTIAKDGLEGLALARSLHPDVVVTDALMPGLDGRQLCLTLKNDPATSDIRVVIMTSVYRNTRYESEAIAQFRADVFLRKPVTLTQLGRTIAALGEKKSA